VLVTRGVRLVSSSCTDPAHPAHPARPGDSAAACAQHTKAPACRGPWSTLRCCLQRRAETDAGARLQAMPMSLFATSIRWRRCGRRRARTR